MESPSHTPVTMEPPDPTLLPLCGRMEPLKLKAEINPSSFKLHFVRNSIMTPRKITNAYLDVTAVRPSTSLTSATSAGWASVEPMSGGIGLPLKVLQN